MQDQLDKLVSSAGNNSESLLSPKKAAKILGVSESSMKRWCDAGQLEILRTSGGHRRISIATLLEFARGQGHQIANPDLIDLPPLTDIAGASEGPSLSELLTNHLSEGNEKAVRSLVFSSWMTGKSLGKLFDSVIAPAFSAIGHKWEAGELQVYEERRACLMMERAFADLRRLVGEPKDTAPLAIGCTLEGDPYTLPTSMCELTLREFGWRTENLGSWEPVESLVAAIETLKPRLFWLSVSAKFDEELLIVALKQISRSTDKHNCALIIGGRSLVDAELRDKLDFSGYCDSMKQFAKLAKQFHP